MLVEMHIQDFALIEQAYLEFGPGLNVLTGETGAGKTLLVTAMNMLMGDRADTSLIRLERNEASIEGLFSIKKGIDDSIVAEMSVNQGDDIVIRRQLLEEGKSKCYINGKLVALSQLNEIGQKLVDLHGQHEHQSLLRQQNQLDYLDAFGGDEALELRMEYERNYLNLNAKKIEYQHLQNQQTDLEKKQDLLRFQINDIQQANLRINEDEELEEQRDILMHSEKLFQAAGNVVQLISGTDTRNPNALDLLREAVSKFQEIKGIDSKIDEICQSTESLVYSLEDIGRATRDYAEQIEFSPSRLDEIETRLNCLSLLKKKYGNTLEEIIEYEAKAHVELDSLIKLDDSIDRLKSEIEYLENTLSELAARLSNVRKKTSEIFQKEVQKCLSELNMPRVKFNISITQHLDDKGLMVGTKAYKSYSDGIDKVEFLIAPNSGEPLRPLHKIASGGEISRTMLALKIALTNVDDIMTFIFDEVDSGVGGKTAYTIGLKLAELTRNHQVICITHLPQIACFADKHFLVDKVVKEGRTIATVMVLDDEDRRNEISRMLSGGEISALSKQHAAETLEEASNLKKEMRKGWYAAV